MSAALCHLKKCWRRSNWGPTLPWRRAPKSLLALCSHCEHILYFLLHWKAGWPARWYSDRLSIVCSFISLSRLTTELIGFFSSVKAPVISQIQNETRIKSFSDFLGIWSTWGMEKASGILSIFFYSRISYLFINAVFSISSMNIYFILCCYLSWK